MKTTSLIVVASLAILSGCRHASLYSITPLHPTEISSASVGAATNGTDVALAASVHAHTRLELVPDVLDGHWFERRIYSKDHDGPVYVELVYCPIVKDGPTVCRTATIWTLDTTTLLEQTSAATVPAATPVPTAAPLSR